VAKNTANGGTTLLEEPADFYRPPTDRESDERPLRPARAQAKPEDDAGEPFLRARRRVPVRRGLLPAWARSGWGKLALGGVVLLALGAVAALIVSVRSFLDHDSRFRIESSASIRIVGNSELSRSDLLAVFGSDIGRNLFFVPLAKRRAELEQIPWVEKATVMRLLPNQLRVAITERKPIAFVEVRGHVALADANGVILSVTPQEVAARHDSFPVVSGLNPADPLSVRSARMQMYQRFIGALDATGEHFSAQVSEVDLSDPDDVRATVPVNGSDLLLHFGQENFLPRWRNYQAHIAQWQQQYPHLASIDLRYDREVVLKMAGDAGTNAAASPATKPAATAKPVAQHTRPSSPAEHKAAAVHAATHKTTHKTQAKHRPASNAHRAPARTQSRQGAA
jgi:cell division protein FtsQ